MCVELLPVIQATCIGTELEIWMHRFVTLKAHLLTVHLQKWKCQLLPYAFHNLHNAFPELGRYGDDGIPVLVAHPLTRHDCRTCRNGCIQARDIPFDVIDMTVNKSDQSEGRSTRARVERSFIPRPTPSFCHILMYHKLGSTVCNISWGVQYAT